MSLVHESDVRGQLLRLQGGNRSLDLCARMNYETEVLDYIDTFSREQVFFDVGACEGRFSLYAAQKGLRVFAFEPDPDNYQCLLRNKKLNQLSDRQLTAFNVALGEFSSLGTMQVGQPWAGGHQKVVDNPYLRYDLNFEIQTTNTVQIHPLDYLIQQRNIPKPHALKIDIDGSERAFIEGAKAVLASKQLQKLIIELAFEDSHFQWINRRLLDYGFEQEKVYAIPNEVDLYNIVYRRIKPTN